MQEVKIFLKNKNGEKLVGLKTIPSERKEKYPAVILVHGFASSKSEFGLFDSLADMLGSDGYLVYRFDFSGCGESEGKYRESSLTKLKEELNTILNFVKNEEKVNNNRVGIVAQSLGTAVVVALTPKIKSLVMLGSVINLKERAIKYLGGDYESKKYGLKAKLGSTMSSVRDRLLKDFSYYNLLDLVKKIDCPVLFIYGSKDNLVTLDETRSYYDRVVGLKEVYIIEGANHWLLDDKDKVDSLTKEWFERHL